MLSTSQLHEIISSDNPYLYRIVLLFNATEKFDCQFTYSKVFNNGTNEIALSKLLNTFVSGAEVNFPL